MARMKEYAKWHQWTKKVNNLHISSCQSTFSSVAYRCGNKITLSWLLAFQPKLVTFRPLLGRLLCHLDAQK